MKIDKWVGSYKVRAFPWVDGNLIYFNVQYYSPGQSLDRPPMFDRTVYITDDSAGRRLVFEYTDTLANYVANLQMKAVPENKIVLTVERGAPVIQPGHRAPHEQRLQRGKCHDEPER